MQSAPRTVGVGVDLGSSATTVSTRRSDDRPETRHYDRDDTDGPNVALAEAVRDAGQHASSVALTVPAAWKSTRRRAHAEAAANAGFDVAVLVTEPEAAARYLAEAEGAQPHPGGPLIVCGLGAGSCNVGVVRREGDRYRVEAAKSAEDLGGRAFDRLLLDHLAARHRAIDPEFWNRVADPAETALRTGLFAEVRRAREHLTEHPSTAVRLAAIGREVRLSREEADQCLTPAVLRIMALVEEVMLEARIGADERTALILVGGASRTPLIATVIRHHLGVQPVLPEFPELVLAEGAALAALARVEETAAAADTAPPERLRTSPGVLVTAMMVGIAIAAIVGAALMNRDPGDQGGADAVTDDIGIGSLPIEAETTEPVATTEPTTDPAPTPEPQEEDEGEASTVPDASPLDSASAASASAADVAAPSETEATDAAVPDVTGVSLADAKRTLAEAGFTNVSAQGERRTGADHDHCATTAQSPGGGKRAGYDDPITLSYVFVGNDDC
ncbi:Hsp70 family protein [Glycomyces sp. TRM65418]|uniref:Hsp70 family protein n=1 Tax=Glycomyces sp. TRM65418 TaxID=2867006 RepID=UPI001CE6FC57|nr:Hsp70 family protein [Glycomyces sp. TRM65418]MCC3761633.1 Hsp70 family protein [Glycomyces sp. TRM65418]QZD55727.1 Hsp70 family protein [Glycomyces sp. TRM65418]